MNVDITTLPDYRFVASSGLFPNIVNNEIQAEQNAVTSLNNAGAAAFQSECAKWLSSATLVRNADHGATLPPKPVSPLAWVVLTQDSPAGAQPGKYIARAQTGAVYGVCQDLPPLPSDSPLVTGIVKAGTAPQPTPDQKLDSIAATVLDIQKMLRAALGGTTVTPS